jgi:hypothetical protein
MAKSHLHFLSVSRFVDRDALMRHFGHGIGHSEYGRVHDAEPEARDENGEEMDHWQTSRRQMKAVIAEKTATTVRTL